jgi:putative membrane protein
MANSTSTRKRSLTKGLLAGLLGGVAGAAVILIAEEIFPPQLEDKSALIPALATAAEASLPPTEPARIKSLQYKALHWAFGAAAGGLYGIATEIEPSLAAWRGAAFGVALNRLTHESLLPRMGLTPSKEEQSTQARVSSWISHAAYGVATDSVRRIVRRLL